MGILGGFSIKSRRQKGKTPVRSTSPKEKPTKKPSMVRLGKSNLTEKEKFSLCTKKDCKFIEAAPVPRCFETMFSLGGEIIRLAQIAHCNRWGDVYWQSVPASSLMIGDTFKVEGGKELLAMTNVALGGAIIADKLTDSGELVYVDPTTMVQRMKTAPPVYETAQAEESSKPAKVIEIADAIRKDDPGMSDESAYRIAWRTFCMYIEPGYEGCKGGYPQAPPATSQRKEAQKEVFAQPPFGQDIDVGLESPFSPVEQQKFVSEFRSLLADSWVDFEYFAQAGTPKGYISNEGLRELFDVTEEQAHWVAAALHEAGLGQSDEYGGLFVTNWESYASKQAQKVTEEEIKQTLEGMEIWTNQLPQGLDCVLVSGGKAICKGEDVTDQVDWHKLLDEAFELEIGPEELKEFRQAQKAHYYVTREFTSPEGGGKPRWMDVLRFGGPEHPSEVVGKYDSRAEAEVAKEEMEKRGWPPEGQEEFKQAQKVFAQEEIKVGDKFSAMSGNFVVEKVERGPKAVMEEVFIKYDSGITTEVYLDDFIAALKDGFISRKAQKVFAQDEEIEERTSQKVFQVDEHQRLFGPAKPDSFQVGDKVVYGSQPAMVVGFPEPGKVRIKTLDPKAMSDVLVVDESDPRLVFWARDITAQVEIGVGSRVTLTEDIEVEVPWEAKDQEIPFEIVRIPHKVAIVPKGTEVFIIGEVEDDYWVILQPAGLKFPVRKDQVSTAPPSSYLEAQVPGITWGDRYFDEDLERTYRVVGVQENNRIVLWVEEDSYTMVWGLDVFQDQVSVGTIKKISKVAQVDTSKGLIDLVYQYKERIKELETVLGEVLDWLENNIDPDYQPARFIEIRNKVEDVLRRSAMREAQETPVGVQEITSALRVARNRVDNALEFALKEDWKTTVQIINDAVNVLEDAREMVDPLRQYGEKKAQVPEDEIKAPITPTDRHPGGFSKVMNWDEVQEHENHSDLYDDIEEAQEDLVRFESTYGTTPAIVFCPDEGKYAIIAQKREKEVKAQEPGELELAIIDLVGGWWVGSPGEIQGPTSQQIMNEAEDLGGSPSEVESSINRLLSGGYMELHNEQLFLTRKGTDYKVNW